jgi:N-acetylmuramoyl-L-alanine amidase
MKFFEKMAYVFIGIFIGMSFASQVQAFDENEDRYWLAMNIYFEAGNQSQAGRLAVAHVTMNRVDHWGWPGTIESVVKQGPTFVNWKGNVLPVRNMCQFSWYCDGKADLPEDSKTWEECLDLADLVFSKELHDFTEGSTHYHNDKVHPYWADHLHKTVTIDNHIFYK